MISRSRPVRLPLLNGSLVALRPLPCPATPQPYFPTILIFFFLFHQHRIPQNLANLPHLYNTLTRQDGEIEEATSANSGQRAVVEETQVG